MANPVYDVFCLQDRVDFVDIQRELSIHDAQVSSLLKLIMNKPVLNNPIFKAIALNMGFNSSQIEELWGLLISETVLVPQKLGAQEAPLMISSTNSDPTKIYRHFPRKFGVAKVRRLGFRFGNRYLLAKANHLFMEHRLAKNAIEWAFSGIWLDRARPLFWKTGELTYAGGVFVNPQTSIWLTNLLRDLLTKEECCLYEINLRERTYERINPQQILVDCHPRTFSPVLQQSVIADESTRVPFSPSISIVLSRYRQTGKWYSDKSCTACGAHTDSTVAHAIATAEAVERYAAGIYSFNELDYGVQEKHNERVNPDKLYNLTTSQCETAELRPFNKASCYYWRYGTNIMTRQRVQIIADLCHYPFEPQSYPQRCRWANSSGMAAGRTSGEAQLSALFELIERDAFMRTWIKRKAPPKIPEATLPDELHREIEKIAAIGFIAETLDITSSSVPVTMVAIHRGSWPALVCGVAARNTLQEAILGAWKEAEVGLFCRLKDPVMMHDEKPEINITNVKTPDDHARFFNHPNNQEIASFLWSSPYKSNSDPQKPCFDTKLLQEFNVVNACRQLEIDDVYRVFYDSIHGLEVVRLLSPHLVPLVFGFDQLPRTFLADTCSVPASLSVHPLD
ncbi:MAG: YcaO-like family protein [bacterium]|nr:YcaO-like family protein [bacterium]